MVNITDTRAKNISENIVITGLGSINPLTMAGDKNVEGAWQRLLNGESGIKKISNFEVSGQAGYCNIAGELTDENLDKACLDNLLTAAEQRRNGRFIHLAVMAANQALYDAGLMKDFDSREMILTEEQKNRVSVILGAGIGGIDETCQASIALNKDTRLSPFFVPSCLINMAANVVSIKYGFRGLSKAVVTACASGAHAIMDAYMLLQSGQADYVLAGGAEASICSLGMGGFAAMNALCKGFNDNPQAGSRPYDKKRAGFVMGEGAGVLVLERESDALKRGAKIYASIAGFGGSADAYHVTNPHPSGAALSIKAALQMAKIDSVSNINAHATSTPVGDVSELEAFKSVFGEGLLNIPIAANKGAIGHLLGAAGAVEAIFSILSLRDQKIPPTLNIEELADEAYIDGKPLLIKPEMQRLSGDYALSTSFGFGGTNASLILKKY